MTDKEPKMNDMKKALQHEADRHKESALSSLRKSRREIETIIADIEAGRRPFVMMSGSLGISRDVTDIERDVYAWLTTCQYIGMLENLEARNAKG